jgi:peptidoglycan/LPS O-acetylase OafA/YrhL
MNPHNRSFGLDFMRALAICLVLIAHFAKTNEFFGFWGVEIFFGLSGFLIGQILWRNFIGNEKWTISNVFNFWSRRWWRTLPNYYLFIVVSLFFNYFYYHSLPSWGTFIKYLWFGQNLISRNREFYGVSWSLCIEEWLYLLFPVVLFIYTRFIANKSLAFILTLISFFVGCAYMRYHLVAIGEGDSIRTVTLTRIDAIACGITVAYFFVVKPSTIIVKQAIFFVGIVLLMTPVIAAYGFHTTLEHLRQNQLLLLLVPLGASLTLPLIAIWQEPKFSTKAISKGIENLSLWSYSIYLSHIPILFTVYSIMGSMRTNVYGNLLSKVIGLIITVAVSGLLFKYFEWPLTLKRPKELRSS